MSSHSPRVRPTTLFVINSDPRNSPRPVEAVRIAAGVGVWRKAAIQIYLSGAAVLVLSEFADELMDGGALAQCWPIIAKFGRAVYAEAGTPLLATLGTPPLAYESIDSTQLAVMAARSRNIIHF